MEITSYSYIAALCMCMCGRMYTQLMCVCELVCVEATYCPLESIQPHIIQLAKMICIATYVYAQNTCIQPLSLTALLLSQLCTQLATCTHMRVHTHNTCPHTHAHAHTHNTHMRTHTYTHNTHAYTYTQHTHAYTHIHTQHTHTHLLPMAILQ